MVVEEGIFDVLDSQSFAEFEEKYDKVGRVRFFINGLAAGMYVFAPEQPVVEFFNDYEVEVGDSKVKIYCPEGEPYHYDDIKVRIMPKEDLVQERVLEVGR